MTRLPIKQEIKQTGGPERVDLLEWGAVPSHGPSRSSETPALNKEACWLGVLRSPGTVTCVKLFVKRSIECDVIYSIHASQPLSLKNTVWIAPPRLICCFIARGVALAWAGSCVLKHGLFLYSLIISYLLFIINSWRVTVLQSLTLTPIKQIGIISSRSLNLLDIYSQVCLGQIKAKLCWTLVL